MTHDPNSLDEDLPYVVELDNGPFEGVRIALPKLLPIIWVTELGEGLWGTTCIKIQIDSVLYSFTNKQSDKHFYLYHESPASFS